jgi:hypothetical protein
MSAPDLRMRLDRDHPHLSVPTGMRGARPAFAADLSPENSASFRQDTCARIMLESARCDLIR